MGIAVRIHGNYSEATRTLSAIGIATGTREKLPWGCAGATWATVSTGMAIGPLSKYFEAAEALPGQPHL